MRVFCFLREINKHGANIFVRPVFINLGIKFPSLGKMIMEVCFNETKKDLFKSKGN